MAAVLKLLSRRGEPSRRVRRMFVVFGALLMPLTGVMPLVRELGILRDTGWIIYAMLLVGVGAPLLVLGEFRRNVMRRGNTDERERQRRNEAYRISYRIVEVAVPLGFVAGLALDGATALVDLWPAIYFPFLFYVIFLPYAVFAWREPDAAD